MHVNVKAAGRTIELVKPFSFVPLAELTRDGVKSYVDAQKALMDVMLKTRNGHKVENKSKSKPVRHARRPVRAVKGELHAAHAAV